MTLKLVELKNNSSRKKLSWKKSYWVKKQFSNNTIESNLVNKEKEEKDSATLLQALAAALLVWIKLMRQ